MSSKAMPPPIPPNALSSGKSSNNVKWIRCNDAAGNGCNVIVAAATGYTPVAADQGKDLYAYRYYDNSSGVKTRGKTAYIGPVAAAAATTP